MATEDVRNTNAIQIARNRKIYAKFDANSNKWQAMTGVGAPIGKQVDDPVEALEAAEAILAQADERVNVEEVVLRVFRKIRDSAKYTFMPLPNQSGVMKWWVLEPGNPPTPVGTPFNSVMQALLAIEKLIDEGKSKN